jgi:hypothetical protein
VGIEFVEFEIIKFNKPAVMALIKLYSRSPCDDTDEENKESQGRGSVFGLRNSECLIKVPGSRSQIVVSKLTISKWDEKTDPAPLHKVIPADPIIYHQSPITPIVSRCQII